MKKILCALLCLTLLLVPLFANAEEPSSIFTVNGNATVSATPDIVTLNVCASANSDDVGESQKTLSAIVADTVSALTDLGLKEEDIVTESYYVSPNYNYDSETPTICGYNARHTLNITCRDVSLLDSVITAITNSGVAEIYAIEYSVSNRDELYRQALALALKEARSKATELAESDGCTSVILNSVTEVENYGYASASMMAKSEGLGDDSIATGIHSGTVSVTASVSAEFLAVR